MAWWWGYDIDKLPEDPHARGHGLAADGAVRVLRRAGAAEDVAAGHEGGRLFRLETYGAFVPVGRAGRRGRGRRGLHRLMVPSFVTTADIVPATSSGGFCVTQADVTLMEPCR